MQIDKMFLFLVLCFGIAHTLTIETPTVFPVYKTVSVGSYSFDIGLDESQNFITPKNSTHITEFRVSSAGVTSTVIPISGKSISAILSAGTAQTMKFYLLTSTENLTRCWNYSVSNITCVQERNKTWTCTDAPYNLTACEEKYRKTYAEDSMTTIPLGAGKSKQYAISFETNNWVSGKFNLTFQSVVSPSGSLVLDPDITGCGTLSSAGSYILLNDLTTTTLTNCLSVTASNVIIDCNGFTIRNNKTTTIGKSDILIDNSDANMNNVSVKNCILSTWSNISYGIRATWLSNSSFVNITVENVSASNGSLGTSGTSCTAGGVGSDIFGIYLAKGDNITFANSTFRSLTGGKGGAGGTSNYSDTDCPGGKGGGAYGLYYLLTGSNLIQNITSKTITGGAGGTGGGAYTFGSNGGNGGMSIGIFDNGTASNLVTITNSTTISIVGGAGGVGGLYGNLECLSLTCGACSEILGAGGKGGDAYGIRIASNPNNILENSTITTITGGIGGAGGSKITNLAGTGGAGGYAYGISSGGNNASLSNFSSLSAVAGAGGACGGKCHSAPDGEGGYFYARGGNGGWGTTLSSSGTMRANNFTLLTATKGNGGACTSAIAGTAGYGIGIIGASTLSNYSNGTITTVSSYNIYTNNSAQNSTFTNVSNSNLLLGWGTCTVCNFTVRWYARVNTTATSGTITTTVNDTLARTVYSGTGAITPWFLVNDSMFNNTTNYTWNNHSIYTTNTTASNSTSFNFSIRDVTVNLTLYLVSAVSYSFTISYPVSTSQCWFTATSKTQTCVMCENQTTGTPFYTYTNTGSGTNEWNMSFTSGLPACMKSSVKIGSDACSTATEITTSVVTIASSIAPSAVRQGWAYMNFTACAPVTDTRSLTNTGIG